MPSRRLLQRIELIGGLIAFALGVVGLLAANRTSAYAIPMPRPGPAEEVSAAARAHESESRWTFYIGCCGGFPLVIGGLATAVSAFYTMKDERL